MEKAKAKMEDTVTHITITENRSVCTVGNWKQTTRSRQEKEIVSH